MSDAEWEAHLASLIFCRSAEPAWMQDIRLAQRAINAERARLRAARKPVSSDTESGLSEDR